MSACITQNCIWLEGKHEIPAMQYINLGKHKDGIKNKRRQYYIMPVVSAIFIILVHMFSIKRSLQGVHCYSPSKLGISKCTTADGNTFQVEKSHIRKNVG